MTTKGMRRITFLIGSKYNLLKLGNDKIYLLIDEILADCSQNGAWISNRQKRVEISKKMGISISYYHKLLNRLVENEFLKPQSLRGYYVVNKKFIENIL